MRVICWLALPQDDLPELEDVDVSEITGASSSCPTTKDGKRSEDADEDRSKDEKIEMVSMRKPQSEDLSGGSIFGSSRINTRDQQQSLISEVLSGRCTLLATKSFLILL